MWEVNSKYYRYNKLHLFVSDIVSLQFCLWFCLFTRAFVSKRLVRNEEYYINIVIIELYDMDVTVDAWYGGDC